MKLAVAFTFFACFAYIGEARSFGKKDIHPIEKVIHLLQDLKGGSMQEGKQEQVLYEKFTLWCSESIGTLQDAVADEKEEIDELQDKLSGRNMENETLVKEIFELKDQVAKMQATDHEAYKLDVKDADTYDKKMQDLTDTIGAVSLAIKYMLCANSKTEKDAECEHTVDLSMLLAQKHVRKFLSLISLGTSVTQEQVAKLQSFATPEDEVAMREKSRAERMANRPDQLASGDLSAHVDKYDFKSENVIELLKQLQKKFEDDKLATVKAETNRQNAYELAKKARDNAIAAAQKADAKKTEERGRVEKLIEEAKLSLSDESSNLEVDYKALKDTKAQCALKRAEWEKRSSVREDEIKAIDAAIAILSEAAGVRTDAPKNPVPPPSPVNFLQEASHENPKMAAVVILQNAAIATKSRVLERIAVEVKAHLSGPFDQLINIIEKMIFRLMDEQKQEDEHKLWCDEEIHKTQVMEDNQKDKITDLDADIQAEKAKVSVLTNRIKASREMIAEITKYMEEATEVRNAGKRENMLAIKDSDTAQKALQNAIAVLTAFYKESGDIQKEPWEFIQESGPAKNGLPQNPDTWRNEMNKNVENANGRIISILEGVMEKFVQMKIEAKANDADDEEKYEEAMKDHKVEKTRREKEEEMLSNERKRRSGSIDLMQSRVQGTSTELETTRQYLKDLIPACGAGGNQTNETDASLRYSYTDAYENRKDARTQEIEALKKAQGILADAFNVDKKKKASLFLEINRHAIRP